MGRGIVRETVSFAAGFFSVFILIFLALSSSSLHGDYLLWFIPLLLLLTLYLFKEDKSALKGLATGILGAILMVVLFIIEITIHPPDEE